MRLGAEPQPKGAVSERKGARPRGEAWSTEKGGVVTVVRTRGAAVPCQFRGHSATPVALVVSCRVINL